MGDCYLPVPVRSDFYFLIVDDEFPHRIKGGGESDDKETVIKELMRVRGIGPSMANELYDGGIRSISDIVRTKTIPKSIRICAKYVDDLDQPITLRLANSFLNWLEMILLEASFKDPFVNLWTDTQLVGAHRRGSDSTHDIDVLVTYTDDPPKEILGKDINISKKIVKGIHKALKKCKFFIAKLSKGEVSYECLMRIGEYVRAIDIYLAPETEVGASLLRRTGPDKFVIAIQSYAKSKGYKLNQHGLYERKSMVKVASLTEESIFKVLSLDYIPPDRRENEDVIKSLYENK